MRHGCRRTGGSGGSGRSRTAAPWRVRSAEARRTPGLCPDALHHRTSRGGCGHSCRAGARRRAASAARGRQQGDRDPASLHCPEGRTWLQSGLVQPRSAVGRCSNWMALETWMGPLSTDRAHLPITVADSRGVLIGGRFCASSLMRTTEELVVGSCGGCWIQPPAAPSCTSSQLQTAAPDPS